MARNRLPQGNINQLVKILRNDIHAKANAAMSEGAKNCAQGVKNYLKAAVKKHGLAQLVIVKLVTPNYMFAADDATPYEPEATFTAKVHADIKRIQAPYVESYVDGLCVPANKVKQFQAALESIASMQIAMLTADSNEAKTLFINTKKTIEGIK